MGKPSASDPMRPVPFRVRGARREMKDTVTLELTPGRGGFAFAPGQFNMLYAFGIGEVPISISGNPGKRGTLVHTLKAVGAVTKALCAAKKGDVIGVRGPYGTSWPVDSAAGGDLVVVAGGIGLAPLRPVIHHALAHRSRYGQVVILYGSRSPADLLFARELERLRGRFDVEVRVTVDAAVGKWRGDVGPVTKLIPRVAFDPTRTTAMICGPEIMMRFTVKALLDRFVAPGRIHLSAERNMKCAVGLCGHCQLGPFFVCKDGPVFSYPAISPWLRVREL